MSRQKKNSRRGDPGSVFQRGNKWAYKFYGDPDPLTGKNKPITRSGFETEDDAWEAMREARSAIPAGKHVQPARRTVTQFFEEWFRYVRTSTEATTAANYEAHARAYVLPWIGQRQLQDIKPPVVAALYQQLLSSGRRKRDTNWEMYQIWKTHQEVSATELAEKVGITYAGARKAIRRYEVGRVPQAAALAGIAPKTVKTVHIMLGSAFTTAMVWRYLGANPTVGVKPPTVLKKPHRTWTPAQMTRFLEIARGDRFYALWVLVATTGMRRSELCGLRVDALDLTAASLRMASTRVVAGGSVEDGDGKTIGSRRLLSLDKFTVAVLREHLAHLDSNRKEWGQAYQDHGLVFCWEDGRPIYPDTITEMFNSLVDRAGVPLIKLHDVRHTYATVALRSGVHPKIVSSRLGHSTVAFTLDLYTADIPGLDRQAAEDISGLFLPPDPKEVGG
ncbi:integrase [Kibdelosporangium banguiense]|uniref:Integrase n=1 Tax=Kibdelosporangium banguiense TaxID=1365924 RepID=A0ABS4U1Z4_9PSEU|nr:tyrosine-type recombinase/integrase [Kibdelosporangium banguiense]MBP2330640.1 integrase [Kibdelosporangium banguiense]